MSAVLFAADAAAKDLVGSFEQVTDSHIDVNSDDIAQGFTTGDHSAGYVLTSIKVIASGEDDSEGILGSAVVRKGNPSTGDLVADLTGTGFRLERNDRVHLTAPVGTRLDASTTYYLVLERQGSDGPAFAATGSDDEERRASPGGASAMSTSVGAPTRTADSRTPTPAMS